MAARKYLSSHFSLLVIRMESIKKNIISESYRIYRSRVSGRGSNVLSLIGYFIDSAVILSIGIIFGIITKSSLISFDFVLQSWFVTIFLFRLLYNTKSPLDITPFLTLPIPGFLIADFYSQKELYSFWVFLTYPFILPILIINNLLLFNLLQGCYLVVTIYLTGLAINLFSNFIRIIIDKKRITFSLIIGLIILIYIFLSIKYDFLIIPLFDILTDQPFASMIALVSLCFILWVTMRSCFKKIIYQIHENPSYIRELTVIDNSFAFFRKHYLILLHFKEMIRCKGFQRQMITMFVLIFAGFIFYSIFNSELLGLWFIIGAYPFSMIEYSIVRDSSYFDAIHTKPISVQQLFTSDYLLSVIITTLCFIPALGWVCYKDPANLLSLVTIYLFTIGPSTLMLFQVAVYSNKRFDLFGKKPGNSRIEMSDRQRLVRIIAGIISLIPVAIISLCPDLMSYILIVISIFCIIVYHIWLRNVCDRFERRIYEAMEQFRLQ